MDAHWPFKGFNLPKLGQFLCRFIDPKPSHCDCSRGQPERIEGARGDWAATPPFSPLSKVCSKTKRVLRGLLLVDSLAICHEANQPEASQEESISRGFGD